MANFFCPSLEYFGEDGSTLICGLPLDTASVWQNETFKMAYIKIPQQGIFPYNHRIGEEGWQGNRFQLKGVTSEFHAPSVQELTALIEHIYQCLAPDGALFFHCQGVEVYRIYPILTKIFGHSNFVNDIIWAYGDSGHSGKHFTRLHDTILIFRKSRSFSLNTHDISRLRQDRPRTHTKYHTDSQGRRYYVVSTAGKSYRYYDDDPLIPSDVWNDIPLLGKIDPRRTGYPGQQPPELMERIILSATHKGDTIFDPYCSDGTSAQTALNNDRRFIGCESRAEAIALCRSRMYVTGRPFCIFSPKDNGREDVHLTIRLLADGWAELSDYSSSNSQPWEHQLLTGSTCNSIWWWSVGRLKDGIYTVSEASCRTNDTPALRNRLKCTEGQGNIAAHVSDVFDNDVWILP